MPVLDLIVVSLALQPSLMLLAKDLDILPHKLSRRVPSHPITHAFCLSLILVSFLLPLQELEQIFNACVDNAQTSIKDVRAFGFFEFKELLAR